MPEIKVTDKNELRIIALAIVEQQRRGQLCPVIIKALEEIAERHKEN